MENALKDFEGVEFQISPLRVLADYIDRLTNEAGQGGRDGKDLKCIELYYDELANMGTTLRTTIENIDRALKLPANTELKRPC